MYEFGIIGGSYYLLKGHRIHQLVLRLNQKKAGFLRDSCLLQYLLVLSRPCLCPLERHVYKTIFPSTDTLRKTY